MFKLCVDKYKLNLFSNLVHFWCLFFQTDKQIGQMGGDKSGIKKSNNYNIWVILTFYQKKNNEQKDMVKPMDTIP